MTEGHRATLTDEQFGQGLPEHGQESFRRDLEAQPQEFRLAPHPSIPRSGKPLLIIVLDGLGESK